MIIENFYVYILASKKYGTLYIGATNNLPARLFEHKNNIFQGFTKKYSVHTLVHFETYHDPNDAIAREKNLKNYHRDWKINLINAHNPAWSDLSATWEIPIVRHPDAA